MEFRSLRPDLSDSLAEFFLRLSSLGVEEYFHPHPLTRAEAHARASYIGEDVYCVLLEDRRINGYGMLRGWDEGFDVPSLGIVIDPAHQGAGYGRAFMHHLHETARRRGARTVRLTVKNSNGAAIALYRSLGYVLEPHGPHDLLGLLDLGRAGSSKEGTHDCEQQPKQQ